jgi:hypothetical protein
VVVPSYNHVFASFGPWEEACKKLDTEIIKLFWNRKVNGDIKKGRRLVAKKRVQASYEMGGLKMDTATDTATGLMLNGMQRIRQQGLLEAGRRNFMCQLLEERLREINILNLEELFKIGGPRIWNKIGNRMQERSPYFAKMCKAMADMLKLNEKSKDSWATANIAGHSEMQDLYRITAADGITLATHGFTHVGQLWGKNDMTGRLDRNMDTRYPEDLEMNHRPLVDKCKNLRNRLQGRCVTGTIVLGAFSQITGSLKMSGIYRKLCREAVDASMPGPPSFYTRRKDGIPVPPLDRFMTGYRNLWKMDIPSKTLENSYLVMNRQIWTNEKSFLSRQGGAIERANDNCKLCERKENTMHLLFECEKYSEPLWALTENVIRSAILAEEREGGTNYHFRLHAFMVLYNITGGIPSKYCKIIMIVIQEIKRNIVYRRYQRETASTGGAILYPTERLAAHLTITLQKIFSLRKYQGKSTTFLTAMLNIIKDMQYN